MSNECKHIERLNWNGTLDAVGKAEPHAQTAQQGASLSNLLKNAASDLQNEEFWRINYSYGDLVIKEGVFRLPGVDDHCPACMNLQSRYSARNPAPLLLNLDKNLEVFKICTDLHDTSTGEEYASRTVPVSHRTRGELIGLFEGLRPLIGKDAHYGTFFVSAGSRNVHVILPLRPGKSEIIRRLFGPMLDSDPLDAWNREDFREYGLNYQEANRVASDWRLIKKATSTAHWAASLLLLPQRIIGDRDDSSGTRSKKSTRELFLKLLLEAWRQTQDALEAFVAEAEPHLPGVPYFLDFGGASVPIVLRYLTDCVDGKALLHCPTRKANANGPFQSFLDWATEKPDHEQDSYVPLIIEPRCLDGQTDGTSGFVSVIHPLIPTSLRFASRGADWSTRKVTAALAPHLQDRAIANLITVHRGKTTDIGRLGWSSSVRAWLKEQGVKSHGSKLARGRCLEKFMTVTYRRDVHSQPNALRIEKP
jgi:hypothetical protein